MSLHNPFLTSLQATGLSLQFAVPAPPLPSPPLTRSTFVGRPFGKAGIRVSVDLAHILSRAYRQQEAAWRRRHDFCANVTARGSGALWEELSGGSKVSEMIFTEIIISFTRPTAFSTLTLMLSSSACWCLSYFITSAHCFPFFIEDDPTPSLIPPQFYLLARS